MATTSQLNPQIIETLRGHAALLANLEGIGDGEMQATLAEITHLGSEMLALIDGDDSVLS